MRSIIVFVDDLYEELELWVPKIRLEEAGFKTVVAGPAAGKEYKGKHGYPCKSEVSFEAVQVSQFDGIVIPGGYAPDHMRRHPKALQIVKQLSEDEKLIAFICHAGWVPISAKILKGRKVTGYFSIKDDLVNAGAHYSDEPVVVDKNFVSSRFPDDLPHFCKAMLKVLG